MEEMDGNLGRTWERDAKIHYETGRGEKRGHRGMEQEQRLEGGSWTWPQCNAHARDLRWGEKQGWGEIGEVMM